MKNLNKIILMRHYIYKANLHNIRMKQYTTMTYLFFFSLVTKYKIQQILTTKYLIFIYFNVAKSQFTEITKNIQNFVI